MPNPNESLDVQDFEGESGIEGLPENSEELWTRLKEKRYVGEDDQNCLLCDFRFLAQCQISVHFLLFFFRKKGDFFHNFNKSQLTIDFSVPSQKF